MADLRTRLRHAINQLHEHTTLHGNLLQVLVAVGVAATVAGAALASSTATGHWHDALRAEIKWTAAAVEDTRLVYAAEGPLALDVAIAETRARSLRTTGDAALPKWAAMSEEQAAGHLRMARSDGTGTLLDDRYRFDAGGYDVQRRLADLRAANTGLRDLDPDDIMARGDAAQRRATIWMISVIPMIFAILIGRMLLKRRTSRSATGSTANEPNVDLIPELDGTGSQPALTLLIVLGWIAITALPIAQIISSNQEQRALTSAARQAQHLTATISASGLLLAYQAETAREITAADLRTDSGVLAASYLPDERLAATLGQWMAAESAAVAEVREVAAAMAAPPTSADGVDARTRAMLTSAPDEWTVLRAEQNRTADQAESAGDRGDALQLAILLAATSLNLAILASTDPPRRALVSRTAAGLLMSAAAVVIMAGVS